MRRALLPLLVLLAACGGGGDDAKAEYLEQAEARCKQANEQLDQARKEQPSSVAAVPAYVERLLGVARSTTEAFAQLEPPADDRADIEAKVTKPLQEQLVVGERYAADVKAAAAKNDTSALLKLLGSAPTETKADVAFMREYGFDECAKAADTGATGR